MECMECTRYLFVASGIRYIIGTSLLAYKDQKTNPEVGSGDRHLPLSCLVGRVSGRIAGLIELDRATLEGQAGHKQN